MIEIIWYLSFSVWLILLRIIHSRSIHAIANGKISFLFNGWVVFHCLYIYISHLLYPFIYWWVASISWLLWIMLQLTRGIFVVVVQLLSHVQLFVNLWTVALQAYLSFTISQSLFKLMSIESVILSNHLILCHPLLLLPSVFLSVRVFSNELTLHSSGGQSNGASAS